MIVVHRVLNGGIYRAAFLPLLFVLAIAGFSLSDRPAPLGSNLAPGAFEGARAYAELQRLADRFPSRSPGSRADSELAGYIAGAIRGLGSPAAGGFAVQTRDFRAQTVVGERTLQTVIARRPGTTDEQPIVIVAHRDAAGVGARAELSATAVLLELARIFAASETQRTIVLVSTSGGSGGNAGAADFAAHALGRPEQHGDAAIVLGDLAGTRAGLPFLSGLSAVPGFAPQLLQRTVAQAFVQQAGVQPVTPTLLDDLAQLAFPLTLGEQGPLNAHGLPAVLIQAGGERPPPPSEPVSASRLEAFGRAVLSAVYALDAGAEVGPAGEAELPVEHKLLPEWTLRLIVAALLLPALLTAGDGLARLRRERRGPAGRWLVWALACGLPFLLAALFALLLGALGVMPSPYPPVAPNALALHGASLEAVLAVGLVLVLAWMTWPAFVRRCALPVLPSAQEARLAVVLVLGALAAVVWLIDPLAALLLVPALHLWLALVDGSDVDSPLGRAPLLAPVTLVVLGLVPLAALIAFYAVKLGLDFGGVANTALLLVAGGRIGFGGLLLWSIAAGLPVAALLAALAPAPALGSGQAPPERDVELVELAPIRGPMSYAGPGSLGGTDSALRR